MTLTCTLCSRICDDGYTYRTMKKLTLWDIILLCLRKPFILYTVLKYLRSKFMDDVIPQKFFNNVG